MIAAVPNTQINETYPFQSLMQRRGYGGEPEEFLFLKAPEGFTDSQITEIETLGGVIYLSPAEFKMKYLNYYTRQEGEKYYLIYDYIKEGIHNIKSIPYEVDYNLLGLHKKRTFVKGELQKIEYFANYDPSTQTHSTLILREERSYIRNADDYLDHRILTITWMFNDETEGQQKQTTKFYAIEEAVAEGKRRRENIVNSLKFSTVALIAQTQQITIIAAEDAAKPFLRSIITDIDLFVAGDKDPLIDNITNNTTDSFLDDVIDENNTTIRMYLLGELNF